MNRAYRSLIGIAAGVLLTVAGLYGWVGAYSFMAAGAGLLAAVISTGFLWWSQSFEDYCPPHPCMWLLFALAAGLHLYENLFEGSDSFSVGMFVWPLAPYILALVLSCFRATRVAALGGAAAALLMDAWTFRTVFVTPTSSTAALALIWIPLWNILVFVPGVTSAIWLINHYRRAPMQAP